MGTLGYPVPPTADRHTAAAALPDTVERLGYPSRRFIVRPLRHSQGRGWRIADNPADFTEGSEYVQAIYPKNHEYRIIAIRGEPLITLLKRIPDGLPRSQPWNHSNGSSFVTVTDPSNNRLRHTDLYDRIASTPLFKSIDLIGFDVMYRRNGEYALCEVNLCPALQISSNIEKVACYVRSDRKSVV